MHDSRISDEDARSRGTNSSRTLPAVGKATRINLLLSRWLSTAHAVTGAADTFNHVHLSGRLLLP